MSRATRLLLVNRGVTLSARLGAFGSDEALAPGEQEKATALGMLLPRSEVILSAPETSALMTAEAFGREIQVDAALGDIGYGEWQGKAIQEIAGTDPQGLQAWMADPEASPHGGESIASLHGRVNAWLDAHLQTGGQIIAVSHSATIRMIILSILGAPLASFWKIDIELLSLTEMTSDGRRWALRSVGVPSATP